MLALLEVVAIAVVACLSGAISYRLLRSSVSPSARADRDRAEGEPHDHEDTMLEARRLRSESEGFARAAEGRAQEDWVGMYDRGRKR